MPGAARGLLPLLLSAPVLVGASAWAVTDTTWRAYSVPALALVAAVDAWPGHRRRELVVFALSLVSLGSIWVTGGAPGLLPVAVATGLAALVAVLISYRARAAAESRRVPISRPATAHPADENGPKHDRGPAVRRTTDPAPPIETRLPAATQAIPRSEWRPPQRRPVFPRGTDPTTPRSRVPLLASIDSLGLRMALTTRLGPRVPRHEREKYPMVVIYRSRGVLVGDDGRQDNRYLIRVRVPAMNFRYLLRRPDVLAALRRLASRPVDSGLRASAVAAIKRQVAGSGPRRPALRFDLPRARVRVVHARSSAPGRVDIDRCRRVRIGDRVHQRNRFSLRAEGVGVDPGILLREARGVAEALVGVIAGRVSPARLNRTVERRIAEEAARRDEALSTRIALPVSEPIRVEGARAVAFGERIVVDDRTDYRIATPRVTVPDLAEIQRSWQPDRPDFESFPERDRGPDPADGFDLSP